MAHMESQRVSSARLQDRESETEADVTVFNREDGQRFHDTEETNKDPFRTFQLGQTFEKMSANPVRMGKGIVVEEQHVGLRNAVFSDASWPESDRDTIPKKHLNIRWYGQWLAEQHKRHAHVITTLEDEKGDYLKYKMCFIATSSFVKGREGISIDDVVRYLQEQGIMIREPDAINEQRLLIFTILGYQSMLYLPAFDICSPYELAISNNHRSNGELFSDPSKISVQMAERPLYLFLREFGDVLPRRMNNQSVQGNENYNDTVTLCPPEFNAHLLGILLRISFRWVDTLGLHLHYDKASRTLSIFKYPSFCQAMLDCRGAIYSFASPEKESPHPRKEDIRQFLKEVLLSYRLLFGQTSSSRNFYDVIKPESKNLLELDNLLDSLCASETIGRNAYNTPEDQFVYIPTYDFPMLHERIVPIAKELQARRPNSMIDLFRDKRDRLQYWTFCLVAIIGGVSIILSFVQVLLQAVEIHRG